LSVTGISPSPEFADDSMFGLYISKESLFCKHETLGSMIIFSHSPGRPLSGSFRKGGGKGGLAKFPRGPLIFICVDRSVCVYMHDNEIEIDVGRLAYKLPDLLQVIV